MKNLLTIISLAILFSCSDSKKDASAAKTKIVCGDSLEQQMFDENGKEYTVKVAGKCDTVPVTDEP